jgi:multicomponent Na+:H+ antiporter subunit A
MVGLRPFIGQKATTPQDSHEGPLSLWAGPLFLAGLGFIAGLWPALVESSLLSPGVRSVLGYPIPLELALWHGWNPTLLLSGATLAGGLGLYAMRSFLIRVFTRFQSVSQWGPERAYSLLLNGMIDLAQTQTRWLQNGYLRVYLMVILVATVGLSGYAMIEKVGFIPWLEWTEIRFYEMALAVLILLGALAAAHSTSRLGAVAALGVSGYSLAMIYILFGALELGITQFLIETLMVILFVLVLYHLPQFAVLSTPSSRGRDAVIAAMAGGLMSVLTLLAIESRFHPAISDFFSRNSLTEAHGRNIVNVILVDFRALDTLGEITVLAVAAIGVLAMLKLRIGKGKSL